MREEWAPCVSDFPQLVGWHHPPGPSAPPSGQPPACLFLLSFRVWRYSACLCTKIALTQIFPLLLLPLYLPSPLFSVVARLLVAFPSIFWFFFAPRKYGRVTRKRPQSFFFFLSSPLSYFCIHFFIHSSPPSLFLFFPFGFGRHSQTLGPP